VSQSKQEDDKPNIYVVDDDQAVLDSLDWLMSSVEMVIQTFASAEFFRRF